MPLPRVLCLILCLSVQSLFAGSIANAQTIAPRVVAVLISADVGNARVARLESALQGLNIETLLVEGPNDSELRALLQRFAAIALETDVALVYIEAPILQLGERTFVASQGLTLPRASALLTRAVPLSAFARAAALSQSGGLVVVGAQTFEGPIPTGAIATIAAPDPRNGLAPVIFMPEAAADSALAALEIVLDGPTVELGAMMDALSSINGVTRSQTLARPVVLRAPAPAPAPVTRTQTPAIATTTATTTVAPATGSALPEAEAGSAENTLPEPEPEPANGAAPALPQVSAAETAAQTAPPENLAPRRVSIEELQSLENNLSRSDKRNIQRGLRERGFYRGLIDGLFGRQTRIAIEAFQESLEAEPTGILTEEQLTMFL